MAAVRDAAARVSVAPAKGSPRSADRQVKEEPTRLRSHTGSEHAAGGPFQPVREVDAGQIQHLDEPQYEQHTRVGAA
jgi:hypothetical protein